MVGPKGKTWNKVRSFSYTYGKLDAKLRTRKSRTASQSRKETSSSRSIIFL